LHSQESQDGEGYDSGERGKRRLTMNKASKIWLSSVLLSGVLASCMPAQTAPTITPAAAPIVMTYGGTLTGAEQNPPITVAGTGTVTLTLTDGKITLTGSYSGLTGVATASHIHGPAAKGANSGVFCPLMLMPGATAGAGSLMEGDCGKKVLTAADMADLAAGKWYVNVHTAANGGGEVRAQLMAK
jgi:hypothetical protein